MENNGYDPPNSCFLFDFDGVEAGLNVVHDADAPLEKHTKFTDVDVEWLKAMDEAMRNGPETRV